MIKLNQLATICGNKSNCVYENKDIFHVMKYSPSDHPCNCEIITSKMLDYYIELQIMKALYCDIQ